LWLWRLIGALLSAPCLSSLLPFGASMLMRRTRSVDAAFGSWCVARHWSRVNFQLLPSSNGFHRA
jgi:hypothetical protein